MAAQIDTIEIGTTIGGKYKVHKLIGEGGMGAVYLAENLDIGRQVALKVLHAKLGRDESVMARFRQEARAAAAIEHPNIVDVLDMGQTDNGEAFIVMERLEGETLAARLKQRGVLSVTEAITIVSEVLDALAAAHQKGIIHRDLKPDNIFLVWRPKWTVKILDFGISRLVAPEELRLTASNTTMGSVLYMPPEQARDAKAAGPRADLYTIGAVLYHALAGRPPFLGERYSEVLSAVLTEPHTPLEKVASALPAGLSELVDSLLSKTPERRPASASALREQLLAMIGTTPASAAPQRDSLLETLPAGAAAAAATSEGVALAGTVSTDAPAVADPALGATVASAAPGTSAAVHAIGATVSTAAPGSVAVAIPEASKAARPLTRWVAVIATGVVAAGVATALLWPPGDKTGTAALPDSAMAGSDLATPTDAIAESTTDGAVDAPPDAPPDAPDAPRTPARATRVTPDARPIVRPTADAAEAPRDAGTVGKEGFIDFVNPGTVPPP